MTCIGYREAKTKRMLECVGLGTVCLAVHTVGTASGKLSQQLCQQFLEVFVLEVPLLGLLNVRPKRQMTHTKNCGFQITIFACTSWFPILLLGLHYFSPGSFFECEALVQTVI